MRHDFTGSEFDRFTRDRLTGHHRFLYVGHHQGVAYYVHAAVFAAATSADYAHVRRLARIGTGEVFALGELRARYVGQFIPEYAPDRHADGRLRAGNDAPIEQADEAGATLSREHVRDVLLAEDDEIGSANVDAILRKLGLSRPEPYKVVTVEVQIKTLSVAGDRALRTVADQYVNQALGTQPASRAATPISVRVLPDIVEVNGR